MVNGSFLESNSDDGLRACLADEFDYIYIFNLRGNQRTSGETSRKEGGKFFDSGSRTPVAICFFVKLDSSMDCHADKSARNDDKTSPLSHCETSAGSRGNPQSKATIYYYDIGDYLDRQTKLNIIQNFKSIESMEAQGLFTTITPNKDYDWINQRDYSFMAFMPMANKKLKEVPLSAIPSLKNKDKIDAEVFAENYVDMFSMLSMGISTSRDFWVYNFSAKSLESNMTRMIDNYNAEVEKHKADSTYKPTMDSTKINWSHKIFETFKKSKRLDFDENGLIVESIYRPFCKAHLYMSSILNERLYQMPQLFPTPRTQEIAVLDCEAVVSKSARDFYATHRYLPNMAICISDDDGQGGALMTNITIDNGLFKHAQCFPLYYYERVESSAENGQMTIDYDLVESMDCHALPSDKTRNDDKTDTPTPSLRGGGKATNEAIHKNTDSSAKVDCHADKSARNDKNTAYYKRKDAIRDEALAFFQNAYNDSTITKEDMFYYIYAILNHPAYIAKYKDNLSKMLPRIPLMQDFWGFVASGRALAALHINYESYNKPDSRAFACLAKDLQEFKTSAKGLFEKDFRQKAREDIEHLSEEDFRIETIKFHTKGVKDSILLNDKIAIVNIPHKAYAYKVNGKSAIEWILDRYKISTDKASGIVNDPNLYESTSGALAGLKGGRYVLELLLSVCEMSIQTMEAIESMPEYKLLSQNEKHSQT